MVNPLDLTTVELAGGPLVLASDSEVDDVEARLGVRLPDGYREYVTQLGEGSLNDFLRVFPPWRILAKLDEHRGMMSAYWLWDEGQASFGQDQAMESIPIADTIDGDVIVVHAAQPNQIIILPRNGEHLHARGPDLLETINWVCSGGAIQQLGPRRSFEPFDSRSMTRDPAVSTEAGSAGSSPREGRMGQPDASTQGTPADGHQPRDVLMAYFAELYAVEEWAAKAAGGPRAFRGASPPDTGHIDDELFERSDAVRARYCAPKLAHALRGTTVTVSWPPEHDPAAMRVLDEKETRPGRIVIRTSEGTDPVFLNEYAIERSDGEWRVASQKTLGQDQSQPRQEPERRGFLSGLLGRSRKDTP